MSAAPRPADPDSRARTHLANERTFLAWLRTGLVALGLGLAAAQFLGEPVVAGVSLILPLSVLLVLSGVVLTAVAGVRFAEARDRIDDGTYRPRGGAIVLAVVIVAAIGLVSLLVVVALVPSG